ncbi:unnamed protein product [Calicophoron daubneyi]|uniref:Uncharacterized protein n=1 Tax=Calicophoron daubneyi TaxID=300641 RepID=A0AAV2T851_CALDB
MLNRSSLRKTRNRKCSSIVRHVEQQTQSATVKTLGALSGVRPDKSRNFHILNLVLDYVAFAIESETAPDGHHKGTLAQLLTSQTLEYQQNLILLLKAYLTVPNPALDTCAHNFGSNVLIKMHRLENVMRNKLSVLRKTSTSQNRYGLGRPVIHQRPVEDSAEVSESSKGSFGHMHECKNRYIETLRHLKRAVDRIGEILLDIDV